MEEITPDFGGASLEELEAMDSEELIAFRVTQTKRRRALKAAAVITKQMLEDKLQVEQDRRVRRSSTMHLKPAAAELSTAMHTPTRNGGAE